MDDLVKYKLELLKQELDSLQNGIRSYDPILFTIKGWSITVFSAATFLAIDKQRPSLHIFCAGAIIMFWLLDASFKSLQTIMIKRYDKVEHFAQNLPLEENALVTQLKGQSFIFPNTGAAFREYGKDKKHPIWREAKLPFTAMLYSIMLLLLAGLWVLQKVFSKI